MKTKLPLPDNKTVCDICNATFAVNKNSVREERLTLEKGDFLHEVVLTYLYCPNCGNRNHETLNVARRTCGYIGSQFWNHGRTEEIRDRVLHL